MYHESAGAKLTFLSFSGMLGCLGRDTMTSACLFLDYMQIETAHFNLEQVHGIFFPGKPECL